MGSTSFRHHRYLMFLWWLVEVLFSELHPVFVRSTSSSEFDVFNFTRSSYNATISENAVGKTYVLPSEKMGIYMSDPTMDIRYKIELGDHDRFFKAESLRVGDFCFLLVRTRTEGVHNVLNRERRDEYRLQIKAAFKPRGRLKVELTAKTEVRVVILDTNDLYPLFYPTTYETSVSEDAALHSSILRVVAEDADVGVNGEIYYSLLESSEQFAVHPTTGVVSLTRLLNYKEQYRYDLTVLAQDRGAKFRVSDYARVSTAKLRIDVTVVNHHAPELSLQHLPSIVEDGNVDVYAIVRVTDADDGVHGQIERVEIIDGDADGHFRLRPGKTPGEYNIAVLKLVDRELTPYGYNLTLKATDRGTPPRSKIQKIHVHVSDFNDHSPVFDKQEYRVDIEEVAPIDTPLISVKASDADEGRNAEVLYRISEGNDDGFFNLEPQTGLLLVAKPLDAETRFTYTLIITAEDQGTNGMRKHGQCKVHVRVLDANDNDPSFSVPLAEAWVKENEFIGTVIHTVKAKDLDSGENGYVSYSIANLNPTPFSVDHFSGEVKMKEVLDYESMRRTYVLKIRASDWGTPYRRQSETTLRVHLKDINDNRPQFERVDCAGYLSRSAPRGTEVITLSAIDFDAGNIITYRIVAGNDDHCFSLDPPSGVVTLVCDLQSQKTPSRGERYLNFTASDGEHFADVMAVKITLVNNNRNHELANNNAAFQCRETGVAQRLTELMALVEKNNHQANVDVLAQLPGRYGQNRNAPEFATTLPTEIEVNESVPVGMQLLDFKAIDRDLGFNGQVVYALSQGNKDRCFKMDMYKGTLMVDAPLDRERTSRFTLNITAWDLGRPQKMSYRMLVVNVGDANDNAPRFTKSSYVFTLPENVALDTTVVRLEATDRDIGANAEVSYSLVSGTEDFSVNASTGYLTVISALDREKQDRYELRVKAVDGAEENPLTATAAVLILVSDVNDNAPRFASNNFVARVMEDIPVGTVVTTLSALDPDLGDGGRVAYSLVDGGRDHFQVDRETGMIRLVRKLDFEEWKQFNVTVSACDRGNPHPLCTRVYLLVEVVDVNENFHAPRFGNFVVNGSIRENQPIGTFVLKVLAVDDDKAEQDSRVIYSIRGGDGLGRFSIDDQGNIRTLEVLDRETSHRYWLTVYAQDRGAVPLSSRLEVYVEVLDENDNVPQTQDPVYYPSIPENSPPGTSVIKIEAYDLDLDPEQQLTYRITSGNPQGFFEIDKDTGIITATSRRLDREKQEEHVLEVTVSDNGNPSLSSVAQVVIAVTDVNDNTPAFAGGLHRFRILEVPQLDSDIQLFRVVAQDLDEGPNADISYSIKPGKESGRFRINQSTGVIFSQNLAAGTEFEFTIKAEDNGRPRRSTVTTVQLEVVPRPQSSYNAPVIQNQNVEVQVVENEVVGYLVAQIQAHDADNDHLFYSIIEGNDDDEFAMNIGTGEVLLAKALNYERKQLYHLNVSVSDGIHSIHTQLKIKVIDFNNDHRPEFSESVYQVEVSEDIPVDTEVVQIVATDEDEDKRVFYVIHSSIHPNSIHKFKIDSSTGLISTKERLDRETLHHHVLTILAADYGVPSKHNFARVIVDVRDYNDHAPTFLAEVFEGRVYETAALRTAVVQVMAVDRDTGKNAEIRFSILSGNLGSAFSIDPTLGLIYVSKELSIRTTPEYHLVVKAVDRGNPSLSSTTRVHITVTIADDAPPRFDTSVYSVETLENEQEGTTVTTVNAVSRSSIYYELVLGNDDGAFVINPNSGTISCTSPLDYETTNFYNLTVRAVNMVNQKTDCFVLVHVLDANDNAPHFTKKVYFGNVSESASIGSVALNELGAPLVVTAEDLDAELNSLLVYEIVEKSAQKLFTIDAGTGALRTIVKLDHELQSVIEFTVQASDMGRPQRTAELPAKVKIYVTDVNDSPPLFEFPQYNATLLLPTHEGVLVATVKATDPDSTATSVLTYKITSGNDDKKFDIDKETGAVVVVNAEELDTSYVLVVRASDGVYAATARVHISVEDVPDVGLRFGQEQYYANVMENSTEVSTVAVVNVIGTELNEHVKFHILNPKGLFTIGETSGVIRTAGVPFDREQTLSYVIAVQVQSQYDSSKIAHAIVHVNVMDVNDNKPMFVNLPYYAVVQINAKKGDVVFKAQAVDVDVGDNGEVNYELSDRDGVFQIHRKTGEVTVRRTLDEVNKEYNLIIFADDGGMEPLQAQTSLSIRVIHSQMPVFQLQYYHASIPENIQPYSPVLSMLANSPAGRKLIYSIVDGNTYEEFAVDFNTDPDRSNGPCVIYVVDHLDYETKKNYQLAVRATDSVSGEYSEVLVNVDIEDVNDNSPQFAHSVYRASVTESAAIGVSVTRLEAEDRDYDVNKIVNYHIVTDSKNSTDIFHINSNDGTIFLKQTLDYEKEKLLDFVVLATDGGIPTLSSTTRVWISVLDSNDNAPYFEQPSYSCFLIEGAERGQFITMVVAFDPDVTDQSKLSYSIVAGNEEQAFNINKKTGIVVLGNSYKLKQLVAHTLNISVSDGVHTSFTRVKIDIISANKNSPSFDRLQYDVSIEENLQSGTAIAIVSAKDEDKGSFGQLEYDIQSDYAQDYFTIDPETGEIHSRKSFDREKQDFFEVPITAMDGGGLTAYAVLLVTVIDKNDNAPVFLVKEYNAIVHANATVGSNIVRVVATDADVGVSAMVEYSIYENGASGALVNNIEIFNVDKETGEISLKHSALPYENQVFQFFVRAQDKGIPPLHADVPVDIVVISPQELPPTVELRASQYFVQETTLRGTVVTTLSALSNYTVTYTLASKYSSSDGTNPFQINDDNEIVVSGLLDREVTDMYTLVVKVETLTSPPLTTYVNFTVKVMDDNDNRPEFECTPYHVMVSEDVKEGSSIVRLVARDRDVGHNREVRYSLESVSPATEESSTPFDIDIHTGWITNLVKLDREEVPAYTLKVVAVDNGNPQLSSTTTVEIKVKDYNDNPPIFSQSHYKAAVNEDAHIGTVVITLLTKDADVGLNARVAYYVTDGDPNSHFGIRHNGEIYVYKELDREDIDHYLLEITATDGSFVTTTRVSIDVLDANDNPPVCKASRYVKKVSESIAPSTYILIIEASDADDVHNAKLKFFLNGTGSEDFILDHSNGLLKTARLLDRETKSRYLLIAHVQDREYSDRECVSEVEIILSDVNDNIPEFTQQLYSVTVPEDTELRMLVSKVHATDKDLGINRKVRYSFVDSANGHFVIDDISGIITLAKPLDREEKAMYNLTVRVTDQGTPQLSSIANLLVIVLDINDNPPDFASKYYYASIAENVRLGSDVVRVLATSKDSGINAEISYSIVGGNEHAMFSIHPKTGVLSIQKSLDYEKAREYLLTIQANDGGTPSLSNHATVNISVTDANDNPPVFGQSSYTAVIREDAQVSDRIIQVVARDVDSYPNNRVLYYVTRGDPKSQFRMERHSGFLTVLSSLDRETTASYILEVQAVDSGSPALSSTATILVEVTDANDNPPVFSLSNYSAIVQEDKPLGYTIMKFVVTDADTAPNGAPFTYDIRKGNNGNEFRMVQDGTLRTAALFSHKLKAVYLLQVRVFDSGTPLLFADAWVSVKVIEESQFPPVVTSLEVSVNSYLDEFPGGIIGRIHAVEQDPYDTLTYAIVSNHRHLFDIDAEDGTINALPGLDVGHYHLNISTNDGKFTTYSEVKVLVNLITDEMLENAIIVRIADVSPEDFVLGYHKGFLRAVRSVLAVRLKEIEILSIQPALEETGRLSKREAKKALDVMFSVHKPRSRFFTAEILRKVLLDNKDKMESIMGLKIVRIVDDFCSSSLCKHGDCKSRLTFDDKMLVIVATDTTSYVSPQHHHRLECQCREGFGGKFCDVIINECARATCPSYKICVPDVVHSGYTCQCPSGKAGSHCSKESSNCVENHCYEEKNPISFRGKSYAAYTLVRSMDRHFGVSLRFKTVQSRSCIMYAAGKIDYSILEVANGFIQYRFDCGSGEGLVRVEHVKVNNGQWHEITLIRRGNSAELHVNRKYSAQGSAPGFNDVLNVESNDIYFGAEVQPHPSIHDYEDVRMGYVGCMDNLKVDDVMLPLDTSGTSSIASLKRFVNIEFHCLATVDPGVCGSQPCLNGGTCKGTSSIAYVCHCHPRFSGVNCELDSNPCGSAPCLNGGTCSNRPNDFVCKCPFGLSGKRCDFGRHCNPNPCQNGGTCEETPHGPICKCQGFVGDRCIIDINECSKSPCQNGATCINMSGSFRCQCAPNTTGTTCESVVHGASITSNASNITIEEIVGIVTTVAGIFLLVLIFILIRKCRLNQHRQRQNNDLAMDTPKDVILKNKTQDGIKQNSKLSNLGVTQYSGSQQQHHHHHHSHNHHLPHVPPRPLSYTPSNHDSYSSALNNYETVRSYGSAGDDLENINRYSNEFLQTINKAASIPPTLPPPPPSNSPSDSDSLHKPWSLDNNLKDAYCESKIQNDMKCHVGLPEVPLPSSDNFRDNTNVPSMSIVSSIDDDLPDPPQGNDKGYHWDCSDWARGQNPLPNITEVPTNEVPDSPSVHSNESNTQVGQDDGRPPLVMPSSSSSSLTPRRMLTHEKIEDSANHTLPCLSTHSDEGDRDSEYVCESEFNDNILDDIDPHEPLKPNFEQILAVNGLEYSDGSETYQPSTYNYHMHPDQYLPSYDNIVSANTDTEAEENGNVGSVNGSAIRSDTSHGRGIQNGGVLPSSYGYLGHQKGQRQNVLARRSLDLMNGDDMSVSVGGYTSTNASCSDISGNLCEIEDSELCSDPEFDLDDIHVSKKVVQNTASTAL